MYILDNYLYVVRDNYANFEGRARRSEYWYFVLMNVLISLGLILIYASTESEMAFGLLGIFLIGILTPSLAIIVRRLHDLGKSGGYFFVRFIPIVGGIWYLVLMCTDSTWGSNQYGPNPKGMGNQNNQDDLINSIGRDIQ
jgi:uncharacterized membrane protein YhaH (DUF805 family)